MSFGLLIFKSSFVVGQKIYKLACSIDEEIYKYPSDLNHEEKMQLYYRYLFLIKRAAYLEHTDAQYDYAQQFEDISFLGMNNPMYNPKKCIYWYAKACDKGHAEACNNLAYIYDSEGYGKKDVDLALKLYKKSADLGSDHGKNNYKSMRRSLTREIKHTG
ncbi:tetratricopeptide repeat protein [Pedobacter sp. AW31-3R]|uniref:tetratricopeptide repeat protein n=1 Tax=Pedobacter sp. AW31-3R TaxID=3445781 RepID=UPI003FA1904A